jgi:hypothetical protein
MFLLRWGLDALTLATAGGPIQGRHVLPVTVVVAMLAGETVLRNRTSIRWAGGFAIVVTAAVVLVQLAAWYATAHRFAVGSGGSWQFLASSAWSPPGGWVPWGLCLVAGFGAILIAMRPPRTVTLRSLPSAAGSAG